MEVVTRARQSWRSSGESHLEQENGPQMDFTVVQLEQRNALPPVPDLTPGVREELQGRKVFAIPAPRFPLGDGTIPSSLEVGTWVSKEIQINDTVRIRAGTPHRGLDITAPLGSPVYAAEGGVVEKAVYGDPSGAGTLVEVRSEDGRLQRYFHGKEGSLAVQAGDKIERGALIFQVGLTGYTSGPHLHFEVRGADGSIVDPLRSEYFLRGIADPIEVLDAMYEGRLRPFRVGDRSFAANELVRQLNLIATKDPALREVGGLTLNSEYNEQLDRAVRRYAQLRGLSEELTRPLLAVLRADVAKYTSLPQYPGTDWARERVRR